MGDPRRLAVTGSQQIQASLAADLRAAGYTVVSTIDQSNEPDAVLCLVEKGSDFQAQLQSQLAAIPPNWRFIVISPSLASQDILDALYCGASDYLPFPIADAQALDRAIERCASKRQLMVELQQSRARAEQANRELQKTVQVLEQDQQAGHQAQLRMLPASPLLIEHFEFSHRMVPSLFLSGDFTDYFKVGDDYSTFFIADVAGHGSASGFCTVLLKNLFARKRSNFIHDGDEAIVNPAQMVQLANHELLATNTGKYATMIVGVIQLSTRQLTYTIAGHLPLPVLYANGEASYLQGEGTPAGLMETLEPQEHTLTLPNAFSLGLFSDGILEVIEDADLLEKEQRLLQVFADVEGDRDALFSAFNVPEQGKAPDDIAALYVRSG